MVQLKIKDFGPIKEGYIENDGYITIPDVTLFIGDQGTGKSTIAKILSTCSWIEKALLRDSAIYELEFEGTTEFFDSAHEGDRYDLKYRLEYQNIHSYFSEKTYIEYIGKYYKIIYSNLKTLFISLHAADCNADYFLPQIMYVPAERNFISVVEGAKSVKNLPSPLYTFLDEYEDAIQALEGEQQKLPLDHFIYQYDNSIKQSIILGTKDNHRVSLAEASSGLQSSTPLFLVTNYLSKLVKGDYKSLSRRRLSLESEQSKNNMIDIVREVGADDWQEKEEILKIENRFRNHYFLNIVEEMEQNLFPKSQQRILYDLIRCVNTTLGNSLILTTHSPYVINYLSLAIKAFPIKEKIYAASKKSLIDKLNKIVPEDAIISGEKVAIYELDQEGTIKRLKTWGDNIPSDHNFLNESLMRTNDLFNELLELEDEI